MPPAIHSPSKAITSILRLRKPHSSTHNYATVAAAAAISSSSPPPHPLGYPRTQPPSLKPPEYRKSQLLRQYASLLRSTPLMLLFQHNNVKANEWMAIRRELSSALQKTDDSLRKSKAKIPRLAHGASIQIIQTGIFDAALRIVEFYEPGAQGERLTHVLSESAHRAVEKKKSSHALAPLLAGPLAVVALPVVSPQHLATVLSTLSPRPPQFPAPTRRANPGWHEMAVQSGLQKLLLLGARIEGQVFDVEGMKWVGGIEGGIAGLRAQVVGLLANAGGAGLVGALEGASRSLYFTMESRREMLEEANGGKKEE